MGLSYQDIKVLRFIQNRNQVPLSKVALHFEKNETSIRRNIEKINLYSMNPLIEIDRGRCISQITYPQLVDFIAQLSGNDYSSSIEERIQILITTIFFNGYVNASALYEEWGLSLTTKKQDTAYLRTYLQSRGLQLVTLKKRGLGITGDELRFRFLVIHILHSLLEYTTENQIHPRRANTPLEKQTFEIALPWLLSVSEEASRQLDDLLSTHRLSLNYPSKKFFLLFICLKLSKPFSYHEKQRDILPLAPLDMPLAESPSDRLVYNIVLSLLNVSEPLDVPHDDKLWHTTQHFVFSVIQKLSLSFQLSEEMLHEFYCYFYRELMLNHFQCSFFDKTVEYTKEEFPAIYDAVSTISGLFQQEYAFTFLDEQLSTLTLLMQKYILRNQIISQAKKRVVIVTSINFERISFFLEQIREHVNLEWIHTLNINEIHRLNELEYDHIFCFSTRMFNLLTARNEPVVRLNFFVTSEDIQHLLSLGFTTLKHRFHTTDFASEIAGMNAPEMVTYLKEHYPDHFV